MKFDPHEKDGNSAARLLPTDEDVELRNLAAPPKRGHPSSAITVSWAASGAYLPLCTDKIRNGVKSRPLMALLYATGAAVVALILLLALYKPVRPSIRLSWSPPPSQTLPIGYFANPFGVSVLDENNSPLSGRTVRARVFPIVSTPLTVEVNNRGYKTREVDCGSGFIPGRDWSDVDAAWCHPSVDGGTQNLPFLYNYNATTDAEGLASFSSLILTHGLPGGTYSIVVELVSTPTRYVTTFVKAVAPLTTVRVSPLALLPSDVNPSAANATSQSLDALQRLELGTPFSFTAKVFLETRTLPVAIGAVLVPLDLEHSWLDASAAPSSPPDTYKKLADIVNARSLASVTDSSVRFLADNATVEVDLVFSDVVIRSASSAHMYFGVVAMGSIGILDAAHGALAAQSMAPTDVHVPFLAKSSNGLSVTARRSPSAAATSIPGGPQFATLVVDGFPVAASTGEPLQWAAAPTTFTVTVLAAPSSTPCVSCVVYVDMQPSHLNPLVIDAQTLQHPALHPKTLLMTRFVTDSSGVASIPLIVSAAGAVGVYELTMVCNGVTASFTAEPDAAYVVVAPTPLLFELRWGGAAKQASGLPVETIGGPWAAIPALRVLRADSRTPIAGKNVVLRAAADVRDIGLTYTAIPSDENGWAYLTAIVVTFARVDGAHNFTLLVDGVVAARFERRLEYAPFAEELSAGVCAGVVVLPTTTNVISGVAGSLIDFDAVDVFGESLDFAAVTVRFVIAGERDFALSLSEAPFAIPAATYFGGQFRAFTALPFEVTCESELGESWASHAVIGVMPRIRSTSAQWAWRQSLETFNATVDVVKTEWLDEPAFWEDPAPLVAVQLAMPSYVFMNYPEADFFSLLGGGALIVDGGRDETLVVEQAAPIQFPGYIVVGFKVDGLVTGPVSILFPRAIQTLFTSPLQIRTSALPNGAAAASQWSAFAPFPSQPEVFVGRPGHRVYAELGYVHVPSPPGSLPGPQRSVVWIDLYNNASTLQFGMIATIPSGSTRPALLRAESLASDSAGVATFSRLGLVGLRAGSTYVIRYCTSPSHCVEESSAFVAAAANFTSASHQLTSENGQVFIGEGQEGLLFNSNPVTITLVMSQQPVRLPFVVVTVELTDTAFQWSYKQPPFWLSYPFAWSRPIPPPYGIVAAAGSAGATRTLPIDAGAFGVRSSVPSGRYSITVYTSVPGSAAGTLVLSLDTARVFVHPIAGPVALDKIFRVKVGVFDSSGGLLGLRKLLLSIVSADKKCTGSSCGALTSASSTLATSSMRTGLATFDVAFSDGATGLYIAEVVAADDTSGAVAHDSFNRAAQALAAMFGLPSSVAGEKVLQDPFVTIADHQEITARNQLAQTFSPPPAQRPLRGAAERKSTTTASSPLDALETLSSKISSAMNGVVSVVDEQAFTLKNGVDIVEIITEPRGWDFTIVYAAEVTNSIGGETKDSMRYSGGTSARLRLWRFDASLWEYVPVEGASVDVEIAKNSAGVVIAAYNRSLATSNAEGFITVPPLQLSASDVGRFAFHFSSSGGGGNTSVMFSVSERAEFTTREVMEFAAGAIVVIFSPILLFLVPNSRYGYIPSAFVCTVVVLVLAFSFGIDFANEQGGLLRVYTWYTLSLVCALCLGCLLVGVLDGLGRVAGLHRFRVVNDEKRALATFRYAKWILTARAATQVVREAPPSLFARIKARLDEWSEKVGDTLSGTASKLNDDLAKSFRRSQSFFEANNMQRRVEKQLWRDPAFDTSAANVPVNFIIVASLTCSLVFGLTLLGIHLFSEGVFALGQFRAMLPSVPDAEAAMSTFEVLRHGAFASNATATDDAAAADTAASTSVVDAAAIIFGNPDELLAQFEAQATGAATATANSFLTSTLAATIRAVASVFPKQYSALERTAQFISDANLVSYLRSLHNFLGELQRRMTAAFVVGIVAAVLVVVLTLLHIARSIPRLITDVWRGKLRVEKVSTATTETYIGFHCILFVIVFVTVFAMVFIVVMLLAIDSIRVAIWDRIYIVLFGSIGSMILQKFINLVVVKRFLLDGVWVARPELYAAWHFAALILSVFSGIAESVGRWITALASVTLFFAQVQHSVYPSPMAAGDAPHNSFMSLVVVEAMNTNPLMRCFCAALITEHSLRRLADDGDAATGPDSTMCPDDFGAKVPLCDDGTTAVVVRSPGMLTLCRIYLRFQFRHSRIDREAASPQPPPNDGDLALDVPPQWCTAIPLHAFRRCARRQVRERIANRWWLLLLLSLNPSLRKLRKCYLYVARPGSESPSSTAAVAEENPPMFTESEFLDAPSSAECAPFRTNGARTPDVDL